MFQRQSWVGLSSKSMGELRMGRQYTLGFDGTIGSMPSTYVDSALATGLGFGGMGSRNSDQIQYRSPSFGGFAVHLSTQLAGDTSQASTAAAKNTEARLAYGNGPLAVNLTTASVKNTDGTTSSPTSANVSYDMGSVKLYGGYIDTDRTSGTTMGKGYVAKAYVPVGANSLFVGYAKNDTNKADAYELGNYYSMSKRTRLYAIYGNGSKDFTGSSGIANGKRYALGVIHSF
jgi:predicted porin